MSIMPVAIRKRSWEEHVTHPSGLQYSYDDLDLVCCHGVDSEGPWVGSGASKQGRRTRCASMPEGSHQMPADDNNQMLEMMATVVHDDIKSGHLKLVETNVAQDFQEDSPHDLHVLADTDISKRAAESNCLQNASIKQSGEFLCDSNSRMPSANICYGTDSISHREKTVIGEDGTESRKSHDFSNDETVLKCPYSSREEQQCISISLNNGPSLLESAGEQSGNPPNQQETKESHTEGYNRPPEISEATLKPTSVAELEPQTDLPDVDEEHISTSHHAGATLSAAGLHSSVNLMESGEVTSHTEKTLEPFVTLVFDEKCDKAETETCRTDSADKRDGLNDPERLIENTGLEHCARDIQEGEHDDHDHNRAMDQVYGCEVSEQISVEQHNVDMTAMDTVEEAKSEGAVSKTGTEVISEPKADSDICVRGESSSLTVNNNASSEKLLFGDSKGDPTQTITTQCADQNLVTNSLHQPVENTADCLVSTEVPGCEEQTIPHHLENSCSTLDPIPEVSLVEPDDAAVLTPQKNIGVNLNPNSTSQDSSAGDVHEVPEKYSHNHLLGSVKVNDEVSPEGLHGNQASGHHGSDSPASEVADGQREHYSPEATFSRMEETDEAAQTVINNDAHLTSPFLHEMREPGNHKDDNMVKVRMRKREHGRLDSMVLLLMKLDQLDQEIENALSASSSMGSTPTLHRRQLLDTDVGSGSVSTTLQNSPQPYDIPAAATFDPSPALGAKPKNGSNSAISERENAESSTLVGWVR
ncbi:uncharacterized protein LOC115422360 [Sphaeramia orbicularis]|uniref:uncharacterized protein LOC115422360 n=1 Tax=Sphaeramia orbicularis TaxID=375764 RepID=UPI001181602B|nr:uncharacterized protein LOC115422360 [Sphaeramia orbicularis]